jgi:thiamine pyrophosphate-dependent acetolactate synthase large subunit-like protein
MSKTAADCLVECLLDWGVDTVFGLPGDGINGIMEALRQRQDTIRFIQARHEESWEQLAFLGNPEFGCDLFPIDFAAVAQACGIAGYSVSDPGRCAEVLREALSRPGPALIEAVVDPNEPPLPPTATFEQTKNLVEALARGTPDAAKIARNIALDKIRELV